jgi:multidrug efflux pump subunit AcrA (membrane-fusion protein)
MTPSDDPGDHKTPPKSAGTALVLLLLAVGAGFGVYRLTSHWPASDIHAQEAPQEPTFLIKQGSRIIVPETSPVRNKLQIEPVEERDVQRTLTLPAVVEADPARTVKVLPPVTGRVIDLKVQLGERVSQDQDLAVLDSGDLAQAFSDDEKARAQLKLTKQALDRLIILAKTSAVAIKDREQAENDYAQAQSELERAQTRLRSLGVSAEQKPPSRLLTLKSTDNWQRDRSANREGGFPQRSNRSRDDDRKPGHVVGDSQRARKRHRTSDQGTISRRRVHGLPKRSIQRECFVRERHPRP